MNLWTLTVRNLRFYFRSHLGTLLGAILGSAVLVGALLVGDSIRHSLRRIALARLGTVYAALAANDRFVRAQLADDLQAELPALVAPVIQLAGIASASDGSARANDVQILGVDHRFWAFGGLGGILLNEEDSVVLNERLARQMQAKVGSEILLRFKKPSLLSRDIPLSSEKDSSVVIRARIKGVVSDTGFGRFSLQANQVAPFNVFVPLKLLQNKIGQPDRANLLLVGTDGKAPKGVDELQALLRRRWKIDDLELRSRQLDRGRMELRSDRIFLDAPIVAPMEKLKTNATRILTYFVNELRVDGRSTPYSMVSAIQGAIVPPEMKDEEIMVNQWLADDLSATPGDTLQLAYFIPRAGGRLEERTNRFRMREILPIGGDAADRTLMPDFPGLAQAESSHDWDTGFPIDLARIRDKDEKYWKTYRGTPKAFVTLAAGQKMWANRFGNLTAVRFGLAGEQRPFDAELLRDLSPAKFGLSFQPVREQALKASSQAEDFGELFLGFSLFLIVAALLLTALLFQFALEQRAAEVGTLLALGFSSGRVRRLLLFEGGAIAFVGSLGGVVGGVGYAKAMMLGLATIWHSAVGMSSLTLHAAPGTILIGLLSSNVVSLLTVWFTLRGQARRPAHELLARGNEFEEIPPSKQKRILPLAAMIALGSALAGMGLTLCALFGRNSAAPTLFFGGGSCLVVAGIAGAMVWLRRLGRSTVASHFTLTGMAVRSCTRRRKRSAATIALLASGSFVIIAVAANKLSSSQNMIERSSGTGGFALIARSTVPIFRDLNQQSGRDYHGLGGREMAGVAFVPFRVRDGDDASCLNLNRAQAPRLLGVDPDALDSRKAFTFAGRAKGSSGANPWLRLRSLKESPDPSQPGEIPAVGDAASIQWALKKNIGDTIEYVDERGQPFKVRIVGALANSILQGSLIIDEAAFISRFPSEAGYRMFLIDAPSNRVSQVSAELSRALQDSGFEVTSTVERLAAFNAVQNTYLDTFQILGGLGLLLGSAGLGIVVLRNVLEREPELALLQALGFRTRSLHRLIFSEHAVLLWIGLGLGTVTALVAAWPAVQSRELPYRSLAITLGAVLLSGFVWTWLATRMALRRELLHTLREN